MGRPAASLPRRAVRLASGIVAACFASLTAPPAEALELGELAGSWMAIDDVGPRLWRAGAAPVAEEMLLITADGRFETRLLAIAESACSAGEACAATSLLQRGRVEADAATLAFFRIEPMTGPAGDAARAASAPALGSYVPHLDVEGRRLWLQPAARQGTMRLFVRLSEAEAVRLRAGIRQLTDEPAARWRCYLAQATAGDPAFASIALARAERPADLDAFLDGASLIEAADIRALARAESRAERLAGSALGMYLRARARGEAAPSALARAERIAPLGRAARDIPETVVAALARFTTDTDARDHLACPMPRLAKVRTRPAPATGTGAAAPMR